MSACTPADQDVCRRPFIDALFSEEASPVMQIRVAQPGDAQGISDLVSHLTLKYIASACPAEARDQLLATMSPDAIRHNLANGLRYHLGELDGRLVGVLGMHHRAHIHHLFVAESEHGKGLATRLWAVARETAHADGHCGDITVNASQYAYAIYRHWGFLPDGERQHIDGLIIIPMRWRPGRSTTGDSDFLPDVPPA